MALLSAFAAGLAFWFLFVLLAAQIGWWAGVALLALVAGFLGRDVAKAPLIEG